MTDQTLRTRILGLYQTGEYKNVDNVLETIDNYLTLKRQRLVIEKCPCCHRSTVHKLQVIDEIIKDVRE